MKNIHENQNITQLLNKVSLKLNQPRTQIQISYNYTI